MQRLGGFRAVPNCQRNRHLPPGRTCWIQLARIDEAKVREQRASEFQARETSLEQARSALEALAAALKRLCDPAARVAKELAVRAMLPPEPEPAQSKGLYRLDNVARRSMKSSPRRSPQRGRAGEANREYEEIRDAVADAQQAPARALG